MQVMELHTGARFLHIGCDEVFQMGECRRCRSQMRETLFLSHVARVASFVRNRYNSVTPIIWDDMLRHLSPQSLEEFHIGELVEPMVRNCELCHRKSLWLSYKQHSWQKKETATLSRQTVDHSAPYSACSMYLSQGLEANHSANSEAKNVYGDELPLLHVTWLCCVAELSTGTVAPLFL
jgi:hypothetical protein